MLLSTVLVAILWPGATQAIFLCTGCTVCRGGMDAKERRCTGCTVCRGGMDTN